MIMMSFGARAALLPDAAGVVDSCTDATISRSRARPRGGRESR